jgi:aminoglycoside N3'-acetyltransferase
MHYKDYSVNRVKKIISVYSHIHTKRVRTLDGKNARILRLKQMVCIATTML